ncbi:SPFH domain-containing protein [Phycisphaerales bacterium AB-hyl4]|uniref:SPFH domain-containing protein n=1 Tax=Natronomicrosphaera hydrolytica TaxID=3242702 RepID=A0ABV4U4B2_9BACT
MPQQKIKNPFMHTHDDDCDHDHHHHHHDGEEDLQQLDPAQQSLADALRVSFNILKGLMVLLLIAYIFSGVFWVEEQERAVRLRFGAMVGEPGQQVYEPGWHFGLPYPIEQDIRVPVSQQTINIQRAYWHEISEADLGRSAEELAGRAGPLNPERDGSLLTGDANIFHARFNISYTVTDPAAFFQNVGLARPNVDRLPDGQPAVRSMDFADALVRNVAEQGIIHAFARAEADQIYRQVFPREFALARMRDVMEQMNTGITIDRLDMTDPQLPQPVRSAAQAVTNAESERAQLVEEARQEQARILGEVAGAAHTPLVQLINDYEQARTIEDMDAAGQILDELNETLDRLMLSEDRGALRIGGEVARVINEATTYRTTIGQQIQAEVSLFQAYLEDYRRTPRLLQTRLWQDAREQILSGDVETFYLMGGQFYPVLNRDPALAREREERRLRRQDVERRERQQQR